MPRRLTKEQAAVVGVFTGIACGPFRDVHALAEKLMGGPIFTHQFADERLWKELKERVRPQFLAVCYEEEEKDAEDDEEEGDAGGGEGG
jgi:hypothetical protein